MTATLEMSGISLPNREVYLTLPICWPQWKHQECTCSYFLRAQVTGFLVPAGHHRQSPALHTNRKQM